MDGGAAMERMRRMARLGADAEEGRRGGRATDRTDRRYGGDGARTDGRTDVSGAYGWMDLPGLPLLYGEA